MGKLQRTGLRRWRAAATAWALLSSGAAGVSAGTLLSDNFSYADGLITNEYVYWNNAPAIASPWEMTSGSLLAQGGAGWTGVPDDVAPNGASSNGTNSAVFRLTTVRGDFGDVAVSFSLLNQGLSASPSTPRTDWDGLHVWLRYQSEEHLYYASINRRDGTSVIKKKVPGGPSNGGTYHVIGGPVQHPVPYGSWQNVKASVKNNADGSVTLRLYEGDRLVITATDNGSVGGRPITAAGKVGLRGDNANLKFDDFTVSTLDGAPAPPPPPPAPTGVTATPGDAQATVRWDPVPGAASYNLYRSRFPGVTKANGYKIAGVSSPHVNTGFANGTAYYMVVTAVNAGGESAPSAEVSAVPMPAGATVPPPPAPLPLPFAPLNVSATPADSQATLRWDPVPGAASYNLYYARTPGVTKINGTRISNVSSPYVRTGLANGTPTYMVVTAVNATGESLESAEVSATPVAAIPLPPSGVAAVAGDSEVSVRWNPVPGATAYNLYRSRFPGVTKNNGYKIAGVSSPHVNAGFVNGTTYYMVVTAVNAKGESPDSIQVSAVPSPALPRPPTGVSAIPGDAQVAIRWDPVPGAASYNLYRSRFPGVTKTNGYKIANVSSPYVNTGFVNGTAYYMVVTAVNRTGESAASVEVSATPSAKAAAMASGGSSTGAARVFPNPWRSDQNAGVPITFDHLAPGTSVKVYTASGRLVAELTAEGGSAAWNLADGGDRVSSGIYVYLLTDERGAAKRGVLAVIH